MKAQLFKFVQFFFVLLSLILFVGCGSGAPTASTIIADPSLPIVGIARSEPGEVVSCETCCRRCVIGKACGNSCINVNYECYQPPGCACNKVEDTCYLPMPEPTPSPSPTPDPCAPSVERSLSSADPAFYIASCPISPNPIDCYLTAIALIQQGVLIADPTSAYSTEAALLEFFEAQVRDLENNPQPTPSPIPSSSPSPDPFPSPCPVFTPTPTPTPCQRPSYPTYCPDYWNQDDADIAILEPPTCQLPFLPPQMQCYKHSENKSRRNCYQGGTYESHHIIQEAALRGINGYPNGSSTVARTVLLTQSAHQSANAAQTRPRPSGTYAGERIIAEQALQASGMVDDYEINYQLICADDYLKGILGFEDNTVTNSIN